MTHGPCPVTGEFRGPREHVIQWIRSRPFAVALPCGRVWCRVCAVPCLGAVLRCVWCRVGCCGRVVLRASCRARCHAVCGAECRAESGVVCRPRPGRGNKYRRRLRPIGLVLLNRAAEKVQRGAVQRPVGRHVLLMNRRLPAKNPPTFPSAVRSGGELQKWLCPPGPAASFVLTHSWRDGAWATNVGQ